MTEELKTKIEQHLQDIFSVYDITYVNHKPHPYMLGSGHVVHGAEHFGGMLTESAIEAFEAKGGHCAHTGCRIPYNQHTADKVLFLTLKRNTTNDEASAVLKTIAPIMEEEKIDGVAFVDTPEKFRIT